MRIPKWLLTFTLPALVLVVACEKMLPKAPAADSILDGPVGGLTNSEMSTFLHGDALFNEQIFTVETGLGPGFVATSCGSCHAGDGKGHPFTTLTRFGQYDSNGNTFLHLGGPQLQNRAIPGFKPEQLPAGAPHSNFMPPANTGLGFLELVSDADILAMSDPNDADGDGISGACNWKKIPGYLKVFDFAAPKNGYYIHRFGKKAAAYNLLHQTANAYNQDIGITSVFEPVDPYTGLQTDPEISESDINAVVFYLQTLKAPIRRNSGDAMNVQGEKIFKQIGCENCHRETLKTTTSKTAALSEKLFHPYTDLLLHDMGPALDDGYTEGSALTSEWRTPPLWGLGLSKNSQGGSYFLLHDGRATSIESAIEFHGGEALKSKNNYLLLGDSDKKALIQFLESL
ncbi:MAG: thiol oxidoreductase [Bacteroidetes bacterium]|nr:thiol oxidoreductase [Bacteroidota bacterium]